MYYKLSNNFTVKDLKEAHGLNFKFPDIFERRSIIDGLDEEILPVVLDKAPKTVDLGIWGILPQDFNDDWQVYQKVSNTLNLEIASIISNDHYGKVLQQRRCCILVSGFFGSYYQNGEIYPIYIYSGTSKVMALAAIYNITNDGFVTCSLVLKKANSYIKNIHNISDSMPMVMNVDHMSKWLGPNFTPLSCSGQDDFDTLDMKSHTIAKEFYKNNIIYDNILDPVTYTSLITDS